MLLLERFDWYFSSEHFKTSTKYYQWTPDDHSYVGISNCEYIVYIFRFYYLSHVLFHHKPLQIFVITSSDFVGDTIVENVQYCFIRKTDMIMNILIKIKKLNNTVEFTKTISWLHFGCSE